MNVQTITLPRDAAREKLRHVRAALHKKADAEYQALEAGYEAAAKGLPLLVMSEVLAAAPRDAKGRPKLAVARADRPQVYLYIGTSGGAVFDSNKGARGRRGESDFTRVQLPGHVAPRAPAPHSYAYCVEGYALVPIVPPQCRLNARGQPHDLSEHHILWEVEAWADQPARALPDRDPYLLKRVGGELYAVVAEWDLTDLERAVMAARARA